MQLSPVDTLPNKISTASEWVLWHKALRRRYGKATANMLWLEAWGKWGCAGYGCDANTLELRNYAESQGIRIEGGTWDFIPDALDDVGDFATQAFNVSLTIVLTIIGIVIVFLGLLAWNLGRDPKMIIETAGNVAAARTGGKL